MWLKLRDARLKDLSLEVQYQVSSVYCGIRKMLNCLHLNFSGTELNNGCYISFSLQFIISRLISLFLLFLKEEIPERPLLTYCGIPCSFTGYRGERKQKIMGFFTLGMQNMRERNDHYYNSQSEIKIENREI